jgi:hypothetical protein
MAAKDEIKKKQPQFSYYTRILVAALLYPVALLLLGFFPDMDENRETTIAFLTAFLSSIIILVLIPVVIRGSFAQKIIAIILLLPAAWIGFNGWQDVIYRFMDHPFGR